MTDPTPNTGIEEFIASGKSLPSPAFLPDVELRELISGACGARGVSAGTATFQPGGELAYHLHNFSEAVTVIEGEAEIFVQGRRYLLSKFDAIHFPAQEAHRVLNPSRDRRLVLHWAFATDLPTREMVPDHFLVEDRRNSNPLSGDPENIIRFSASPSYELAERAVFTDLFARRFGAAGICGGYGLFQPGASLPCHVHRCDESITIVSGRAVCEVMGRRYRVSEYDTVFVPEGRPHRFLNESDDPMAMIWVYASDEPERTLVDSRYCTGAWAWPEANLSGGDKAE